MSESIVDNTYVAATGQRFQFGLRTLLVVITFCSVLLYLLVLAPGSLAAPALYLFNSLLATFFATGAVYAGDNLKAFCRGALLPTFVCYLFLNWFFVQIVMNFDWNDPSEWIGFGDEVAVALRRITIGYLLMSALTGLTTLAFKWMVEPKSPRNSASANRVQGS